MAAGKGTRMHSDQAKALHSISGKPILGWQLDCLAACGVARTNVVIGYKAEQVSAFAANRPGVHCVLQSEQLGTGHATKIGLHELAPNQPVAVLAGDVPFISVDLLSRMLAEAKKDKLAIVTCRLTNPKGYGRIVRSDMNHNRVAAIVEEADADAATKTINEVYCGMLATTPGRLAPWLEGLNKNNVQGEYYLPEIIPAALAAGVELVCVEAASSLEVAGVNSLAQLVALERERNLALAAELLAQGVYIADPKRLDLRGDLVCGRDVRIDPNVIIHQRVELANGVEIGAGCVLEDCVIGAHSRIEPFCHISGARLGRNCVVGPYARLRQDTELADGGKVGNFVETKNIFLGRESKANHLSYLGDSQIGARTNIGAGTITCNYDGHKKHQTQLGDDVFIGSNSALVAPVTIGDGAVIGAGSVITRDVPARQLGLGRARQLNKPRKGD